MKDLIWYIFSFRSKRKHDFQQPVSLSVYCGSDYTIITLGSRRATRTLQSGRGLGPKGKIFCSKIVSNQRRTEQTGETKRITKVDLGAKPRRFL